MVRHNRDMKESKFKLVVDPNIKNRLKVGKLKFIRLKVITVFL